MVEADGTQQRRHGQLLLTVNVGIHHVVDVRGKLNPRTLERDDTGRIEHATVGMHALAEEHARRAVQLRHDDALGTIDDKCAVVGHVGNGSQENVLNVRTEVLVVLVGAIQFHPGLERHTVSQSALQALLHGVARRVYEIVQKLKNEAVARVGYREVFCENLV